MAKRIITRRRSFLRMGLAGLATGAIAPMLWIPRRTLASTPVAGMVKHLIIVNLDGGMRSTCLFNANVSQQWNPGEISGVQGGASGTEWGVGGVFPSAAYDGGSLGQIPAVPTISNQICVLGTVDHTPGEDRGDGNHDTAQIRMATGAPNGTRGLLAVVYRDHELYQNGGANTNFPPVIVGGSARLFGTGAGEFGPYRPVVIGSHRDFRNNTEGAAAAQPGWAVEFGNDVDSRLAASRSARHRGMVDGLRDSKRQAETFRPIFTDPVLDVENQPDVAKNGLTNAELMAAFGTENFQLDAAVAMRFLGFGAPAVVIGDGGWDFHSDELVEFQPKALVFARVLAALNFVLKRMDHPDGGTFWDHSMVVVTSEFGRDNTEANGFNSGNGSDHNGRSASRYQALPFMGGVIGKGGRFFGETDATTMDPKSGEPVFSSIGLLATCLDVLGIDATPHFPEPCITEMF